MKIFTAHLEPAFARTEIEILSCNLPGGEISERHNENSRSISNSQWCSANFVVFIVSQRGKYRHLLAFIVRNRQKTHQYTSHIVSSWPQSKFPSFSSQLSLYLIYKNPQKHSKLPQSHKFPIDCWQSVTVTNCQSLLINLALPLSTNYDHSAVISPRHMTII